MGKTTKLGYPTSSLSTITVNGLPLTTTSTDGTAIYADYNFSPDQTEINDYLETSLLNNLPKANTLSPETTDSINQQIKAYTNNGINSINEIYMPMIQKLENDVAKRFGNFDNSIFMDNLNGLESNRTKAVNALAEDVEAKRSDLVDNALDNQYKYLKFLTDYQNQIYNNMLDTLQLNKSNLSLNTDFLSSLYDSLTSQNTSKPNTSSSLDSILKSISSSIEF